MTAPTSGGDGGPLAASLSFEVLYQDAPCGLLSTDEGGTITHANATLLELVGRTSDEVIGSAFRDLLTPGGQLFYETRFQPVLKLEGAVREVALTLKRQDAATVPVIVNARASTAGRDASAVVHLAVVDATQRQDYERELLAARRAAEASERRVAILHSAAASFTSADSEFALAADLAARSKDAFDAVDTAVVLFGEADQVLAGTSDHLGSALSQVQNAHPDGAAMVRGTLVVSSLAEAAQIGHSFAEAIRTLRVEAITVVPLVAEARQLGALINLFGRERHFDEATLQLHHSLASQAALELDRDRLQLQLQAMAMHDQLTGLANRNLMGESLAHALEQAARSRRPMALLFLDLDGFKPINDDLGHRVGDQVLCAVGARIQGAVRASDIVGRFGGDEFLVICDDADEAVARQIAERIVPAIAAPMPAITPDHLLSASVGIAIYRPAEAAAPSAELLVRAADSAMYEAKKQGPGLISVAAL